MMRSRLPREELTSFDEAARLVREATPRLPGIELPLAEALGFVLAESIEAPHDVPPFDCSMVDGFALRARDVDGASPAAPVLLHVAGASAAGTSWDRPVEPGTCIRIFTGSPVPPAADAVAMFEWTSWDARAAHVERAVPTGANVRARGSDLRAGETALEAGCALRPQELGLLASIGVQRAHVARKPRVAILMTGDELLRPGEPMRPGAIRSANHETLAGATRRAGGEPIDLGFAGDRLEELVAALERGRGADVLLTSGGVSVGDHDLVGAALERLGMKRIFWKVAVSPGKPLLFGLLGETLVFGLPGNPVSSMVGFECFVRPALRRLQGDRAPERRPYPARLAAPMRGAGMRRHFARVQVHAAAGELVAVEVEPKGSGNLRSMVRANGLAIVPEGTDVLPAGSLVEVLLLEEE